MELKLPSKSLAIRELTFQLILHAIVFIFYSYDRNNPHIELSQLAFFINYALAAVGINYFLFPRYFYRKKYLYFILGVILIIVLVIFIEEQVLEQIFYPNSKGQSFPGIIPSLLDVLPPIIILSAFKFANDAFRKQKELEVLRAAVQESELQFLKSQINPHFLFNNLNNLYAYALENSPKTPGIILELSDMLRYMLYDCKSDYVSLKKEIKQLENFTKLSELQIEDRGKISYSAKNISDKYQIAPLILIVFIENAFKHSQASLSSNLSIDIKINLNSEGILNFTCTNNYQPISNNENIAHGIGLENVQKRLNILYPDMHQLTINQSQNIYTVSLNLHLNKIRYLLRVKEKHQRERRLLKYELYYHRRPAACSTNP